jgi:hypothetical protein
MAKGELIHGGYEIIQSVEIGGMEVVVAENPDAERPYMAWRRSLGQPFGAESYMLPTYSGDYLEVLREFIRAQSVCADNLGLDRAYRGGPLDDYPLTCGDCVPGGMEDDIKGKVVAVRAESLSPEYRARSHQAMLVTGGFGCSPEARGRAVFGVNVYSGEQERWDRADILGVISEATLPAWAHEKLAVLRKPAEKESVIEKIREAKAAAKAEQPAKPKPHKKSGPEL